MEKYELIILIIRDLILKKFWGELRIKFKDGKIELINKDEQIKI